MIAQLRHKLKVEKSKQVLTSFAGLPLLTELAHNCGLVKDLDAIPGLWERHGAYRTSDYVLGLAMTLAAGGERLDDTRVLREDAGLKRMMLPAMPAANSFGDFLRRFGHRTIHRLGGANAKLARQTLADVRDTLTLDIDSSLIEAHKEEALCTYKGFRGYNPLLAWVEEADVFLAGVFREGNSSPQSHIRSLLHYCRKALPEGRKLRLRSDSAGYRLDVMDYCLRHGMDFAIGADLDNAVREAIEGIPDEKWQLVVRGNDTFLLGETIHVPGGADNAYHLPALRLVVTKKLSGQLELFKDPIKHRAIIANMPATMNTEQVLDFYNDRGKAEKAIGELKIGFGLERLPCGQLKANAAFLQTALIAYNLVQLFKRRALPKSWRPLAIKSLRFRLIGHAGRVVRHAGQIFLKLSADFPFLDVFETARWAVLSPGFANGFA